MVEGPQKSSSQIPLQQDFSRKYVQGRSQVRARTVASTCRDGCKYSLIQNRTGDFGASFALLRRKALQPFPQTFATVPANVCNRPRKRLQPPLQTFASVIANVCGEKTPFVESLPHVYLLSHRSSIYSGHKIRKATSTLCSFSRHGCRLNL